MKDSEKRVHPWVYWEKQTILGRVKRGYVDFRTVFRSHPLLLALCTLLGYLLGRI